MQDELLRKSVEKHGGRNWKKIAASVPDKSGSQCLHRFQRALNPNVIKGPWRPEEDENLRTLVARIGAVHWSRVARAMQGRNGKQCRERCAIRARAHCGLLETASTRLNALLTTQMDQPPEARHLQVDLVT